MHRWTYLALLVAAVVAGAGWTFLRGTGVEVVAVRSAPLQQTVVVSGRVLSPSKVSVGATITGRVEKIAVDDGSSVRAGEVLLSLERAELAAALAQAEANEAAAAARILQWKDVDATNARQQLLQADANFAVAQRNAERQEKLLKQGFIGEAAADESRRALAVARSQLEAARGFAAANTATGSGRRLLQDQLRVASAARATAAAKLEQTRITAPAAGVVLDRNVEPGDIVQPGKILLTLALDGPVRLTALIDEKNLGLLQIGQRARVAADAYPAQPFDAELEYVSPGVDVQRGTVEAKFRIPRAPPFLRADMTVSIDIAVAQKQDAMVVPARAVHEPQSTEPWVLVAQDGRAERRNVQTGARSASDVEVTRGLAAGDAVVVSQGIAPGARVHAH